jgi:YbbR domain-containing protein
VNKQFLTFLFFLLLSGIFWLMMTLNETYEKEVEVPVHITGIPKNVVLTSAAYDTVRVMVRDKGWQLMGYLYGKKLSTIRVPFKSYDRGNGKGQVSASDIRRLVAQQMETSSTVISVKPEKVDFFYNSGECKRVPVRWTGRVIPEELYFISRVTYSPDSVDVYASKEKLDSIQVVYSEKLNHVGFHDTLMVECQLSHGKDVKVVPERVRIGFYTDVLTEGSIDGVPIKCINIPEGLILRTFPAKVRVRFVAGVSRLRTLRPEDFVVIADYQEIQQKSTEKCNLYLRTVPQGISRATLDTKQVDYLIEE